MELLFLYLVVDTERVRVGEWSAACLLKYLGNSVHKRVTKPQLQALWHFDRSRFFLENTAYLASINVFESHTSCTGCL